MENEKYYNAKIVINIKGDKEALDMYEKIKKEILYESELKYFDHEIHLEHSSSSGFRNNLDKQDVSGSVDADYWSERCKHAENIYDNCPCDPDITDAQIESISGYHNFIKESGGKDYR